MSRTEIIYRFMHFEHLLDLLHNHRLPLTNPSKWEDKNDAFAANLGCKDNEAVGICCFTTSKSNSIYRWSKMAPNNLCVRVEFDMKKLENCLSNKELFRSVKYKSIDDLNNDGIASLDECTYIKSRAYAVEKEIRLVTKLPKEQNSQNNIIAYLDNIPSDSLMSIRFSPFLDEDSFLLAKNCLEKYLKEHGWEKAVITHSEILNKQKWQSALLNAAKNLCKKRRNNKKIILNCFNCHQIINTKHPTDRCDCGVEYWRSFEYITEQENLSDEKRGLAYYLLGKSYAKNDISSVFPEYFDQMISYYWQSAFLGNQNAQNELAKLFESNSEELCLITAALLTKANDDEWFKVYLKQLREKDPQSLFKIAEEYENESHTKNHREYAYKFYRKTISSGNFIGRWQTKAMVNIIRMMLFDKSHYDELFNKKICKEPQLGAEIAYWLIVTKRYGDKETKNKADELLQKSKKYFSANPIISKFLDIEN